MDRRAKSSLPSESKKPRFFYGYVIVVAAFFVLIVTHGTQYSFGVFLKPLAQEFGWTREMTSGAYSLEVFLMGLLSIVSGRLTDRFGPRVVISVCGLFLGLGYLLTSRVDSLWQLYLLYGGLIAIGMSGSFVPTASTVARWFVKRRGLMTGIIALGIGLGTMIMPPVATNLSINFGWRVSYTVVGIIALALIIPAAQLFKSDPSKMGQFPDGATGTGGGASTPRNEGLTFREALRTRQLWLFFGAYVCFGFAIHTVLVHTVAHATDIGVSPTVAARLMTTIGGTSLIGRLGLGAVADRSSNRTALIIGLGTMAAALFWLQFAAQPWMLFLFAAVLGFGYGGLAILHPPVVAELFGMKSHGQILGLISFSISVGGTVGPLMAGRMFDVTGSYRIGFLICAIISVVGVVLVSMLKSTRTRVQGRS